MNKTLFDGKEKKLYMQLYTHYKTLIIEGQIPCGAKLPSIRRCAQEYGISRTTVETAYLQLAAEGYAQAQPQSGYYVCEADFSALQTQELPPEADETYPQEVFFSDEGSSGFDFSLWQRYLKSVLHNSERLVGYGHPQGEPELRAAVCDYIVKSREVACTAGQIVIGAGTQSLLHLLYALCGQPADVAMIGPQFKQGMAVFEDHGATVHHFEKLPQDLSVLTQKNIGIVYLFPSHISAQGGVMPVGERTRLLRFANKNGIFIAEDDYDGDLLTGHRAPSLQGLDGGKCVAYLGTFSKLLLPGIRISFMVLPKTLLPVYIRRASLYNQTASKLEQLALSAFIRDGRLAQQVRRTRRNKLKSRQNETQNRSIIRND